MLSYRVDPYRAPSPPLFNIATFLVQIPSFPHPYALSKRFPLQPKTLHIKGFKYIRRICLLYHPDGLKSDFEP